MDSCTTAVSNKASKDLLWSHCGSMPPKNPSRKGGKRSRLGALILSSHSVVAATTLARTAPGRGRRRGASRACRGGCVAAGRSGARPPLPASVCLETPAPAAGSAPAARAGRLKRGGLGLHHPGQGAQCRGTETCPAKSASHRRRPRARLVLTRQCELIQLLKKKPFSFHSEVCPRFNSCLSAHRGLKFLWQAGRAAARCAAPTWPPGASAHP